MKASFIRRHGGLEVVEYGTLADPVPGPGEVLVRVKAAAFNHLDLWVIGGLPGLKLSFPHVLGGDAAGVVEAVGAGVHSFKTAEEVIVHPGLSCGRCAHCLSGWESLCPDYRILGEQVCGTHAELVVVPEVNLFSKPACLSFEESAAVPLVFTTAWQMLVRRAQIQPGETVLVHAAASGVGSAAIQIAKLWGANVIATAGSEAKLELARSLGADHCVNYSQGDWVKAIKALAPGGVDVIFDHLGKEFWPGNIRAIKRGGRIAVCGATTGAVAETDLNHVFFRQIQILGSTMGSKGDFFRVVSFLEQRRLRAVIDRVFPLAEVAQALRRLNERQAFGKVLVRPG